MWALKNCCSPQHQDYFVYHGGCGKNVSLNLSPIIVEGSLFEYEIDYLLLTLWHVSFLHQMRPMGNYTSALVKMKQGALYNTMNYHEPKSSEKFYLMTSFFHLMIDHPHQHVLGNMHYQHTSATQSRHVNKSNANLPQC